MYPNDRRLSARDGTRIAYGVAGQGPPLVFVNGITTSNFFWFRLIDRFRDRATCVTWDLPGHGASEAARSATLCQLDGLVDTLRRVMDAAGAERAPLFGFSMGCQIILEAWRHIPHRIQALLPLLGTYEHMLAAALRPFSHAIDAVIRYGGDPVFDAGMKVLTAIVRRGFSYRLGQLLRLVGPNAAQPDMQYYIDNFPTLDALTVRRIVIAAQEHSAADLMRSIEVPVLIVSGDRDVFAPGFLGRQAHAAIPHSELLLLPYGTHTSLFEHSLEIGNAVESFLTRHGILA